MVHINDIQKKIEALTNFSNDEEVLRDCDSWFATIEIMRNLDLYYLTLEGDSDEVTEWKRH